MTLSPAAEIFRGAAFDPQAIQSMEAAYEKACRGLASGNSARLVREVIAKRVISAATDGERDPDRLCALALETLGVRA
jgi:hypothetical protein